MKDHASRGPVTLTKPQPGAGSRSCRCNRSFSTGSLLLPAAAGVESRGASPVLRRLMLGKMRRSFASGGGAAKVMGRNTSDTG